MVSWVLFSCMLQAFLVCRAVLHEEEALLLAA